MNIFENVIIGSGPSGVSCAKAILEKNKKVLMIDVGKEIDPNIVKKVKTILATNSKDIARNEIINLSKKKINFTKKNVINSDFCYEHFGNNKSNKNIYYSNAYGGFSNVWGAASLPYTDNDIKDWPINSSDLNYSYEKIQDELEIKFEKDNLLDHYPSFSKNNIIKNKINRTSEEKKLYSKIKKFTDSNIKIGYSRLATKKNCPLCLFGCPEKHIYNSIETLNKLLKNKNFTYYKNFKLKKFIENTNLIELHIFDINNNRLIKFFCKKLFLGSGPLSTLEIVTKSIKPSKKFILKENQIFALPIFSLKKIINKYNEISLSSLFIEIINYKQPNKNCHFQVYILNEYLYEQLKSIFILKYIPNFILKPILKRFVFCLGYLHSDYSSQIELTPKYKDEKIYYEIKEIKNNSSKKQIKDICNKFKSNKDFIFNKSIIKLFKFGSGNHFGCLFPMKKDPGYLETFQNGKLNGTKNIYIIDSSNFTNIPPNTITFSLMANAYRIGNLNS